MSPYEIPACAGQPYRPSNGSEGEMFMAAFCDRCKLNADELDGCNILSDSFCYDVGDPEYPKEWTHDGRGRPTCTAFVPEGKP